MYTRSRHRVGRLMETPSSITTTTMVFGSLATGTVSAGTYGGKWLLRSQAALVGGAAVDRVRLSTEAGFAASTGTITHAGANYQDTTATSETPEIIEYEPFLLDNAIQTTLLSLQRADRLEFPTRQGVNKYWLNDLTWISEPRDVLRVMLKHTPVISRNRFFEKWNGVDANGVLTADWWTLAGTSATYARSTTQVRTGLYAAAITRAGTDCTLTQSVGLLDTGVGGTTSAGSLRNQSVNGVAVVWSAVASQVRVGINDGVSTTYSTYHTGGSGWEELTVAKTMDAAATKCDVIVSVEGSNTVCYADDVYAVLASGGTNDSVRRDDYPETEITDQVWYDQGAGTLAMNTPAYGWNAQIVVYTMRPYPGFDPTRLLAGTADGDTQDGPLTTVALGALWRLYDSVPQTPEHVALAARWRAEYEALAAPHLDDEDDGRAGMPLPRIMGSMARRF